MARTPLFSQLRRALQLATGARRSGLTPAAHAEATRTTWDQNRREFLRKTATVAGTVALLGKLPLIGGGCADDSGGSKTTAKVAVVGAGMAGLLCARTLHQGGVTATVYDAGLRVGGRMWSVKDELGQVAELGGEFIDTDHLTLRNLAEELGLVLDDLLVGDAGLTKDVFYFDGQSVPESDIIAAWSSIAPQIAADLAASEESDAELARLDALSIAEYLDGLTGLDPVLRAVLDVGYVGEYGLEITEQSAMNLIWLIGSDDDSEFAIYGVSDERFHCRTGSDSLPTAVAAALPAPAELEHRLTRVTTRSDGRHQLTFDHRGATVEAIYDRVVFAIPWTTLRQVEFSPPLPAEKKELVDNLGYGTNAKLMLGFSSRPWRTEGGASGSAFCDNGPQTLWETSRGQDGAHGIMTVFVGGAEGMAMGQGTAESRAQAYLPKIEAIFPGTQAAYRADSATRMHWPTYVNALGSYACYKPGQAAWSGTEGEPVGSFHFCGEHTSEDFQGYMEGAAESGVRAGDEVLEALGLS